MKKILLLTLLVFSIGLVGCSDDDDNPISMTNMAQVRVAHLSPDAPNVDVRVNGSRVLQDVPFQAVSDYLDLEAGSVNIQVTPAGASAPIVIDATVTLNANTAYTVAATGLLNSNDLSPIVLVDDRTPQSGTAQVRFVHTSPDAPAVDVTVLNGPTLFNNVAFRQAADYLSVNGGTYNLGVSIAASGTQVLTVNGQTLQDNTNYTIFAIGLAGNGSLAALPVVDASVSGSAKPGVARGPEGKLPIFPLAQKAGLTTLATAVEAAGLQKTLTVDGPFTVFAPTNEAFAALDPATLDFLLNNPDELTKILLYHVVAGKVTADQVVNLTSATTVNGADVSITVNGSDVMVNDADVIQTDVLAKNGVVHVINKVLIPPSALNSSAAKPAMAQGPDGKLPIFPLAQKAGLTTLATAVEVAGLQKTLTVDGPFTVFAPTNEAFAALDPATLDFLLNNPDELTKILLYHVVAGKVTADQVVNLTSATTVNGADVSITVNGSDVMVNDADVIQTDVMAKNGVVHVINKVLIPPQS